MVFAIGIPVENSAQKEGNELRYIQRAECKASAVERLEAAGYPPLMAQILSMRGVEDEAAAKLFLSPSLDALHDPFAMKDMSLAVEAINKAIEDKRRIVVFGDYDVDGVTATACMLSYLRERGADAGYYLPTRRGEGYGLNETAVRSLAQSYDMMITVDCGITAANEVAIAKACGLEVIVTDHHEPVAQLPDCICINPKLGYPFDGLCGAGVAGKIIQAMGGIPALESVLDLVAMGTIADIVPLVDENRILAWEGLRRLNQKMRPGIAALAEVSGLLGKEVSSGHVSFALAPRINAGGRMGSSGRSVDMLLTDDRKMALEIAHELDADNRERQAQEQVIFAQAQEQILSKDLRETLALVVVGEDWNPGVIGIVASRMVERYARPVFLLTRDGEHYVGSGRSVPDVSLFSAMDSMGELFVRYGGHDMAAGLTISAENIISFERRLQEYMEKLPPEYFLPTARYDVKAQLSQMTGELVDLLAQLVPTGQGNPQPLFLLESVQAGGARPIGAQGSHLRFNVSDQGRLMGATAFKMGDRAGEADGCVDVLASPERNDYAGDQSIRLLVRAFSPAQDAFAKELEENGDLLCRRWFAGLDTSQALKPGFKRYISLTKERGEDTLRHLITQSHGGVLILCALPAAGRRMEKWLAQEDLLSMVRCTTALPPADPSAPHLLLCPAVNRGEFLKEYRQIVLADGVWQPGWVDILMDQAPGAAIYAMPVQEEDRLWLKETMPPIDHVRSLYKRMRSQATALEGASGFEGLHRMLLPDAEDAMSLEISLRLLKEMDLIRYRQDPFEFSLVRDVQGRRDFQSTPTVQFFDSL